MFNSKVIVVAAFCAALNVGASSVKANDFQSLLSDHLSSGAILLAQDDEFNTLSSSDGNTAAASDDNAAAAADDNTATARDDNAADDNAAKDEETQTKVAEDKPKDEKAETLEEKAARLDKQIKEMETEEGKAAMKAASAAEIEKEKAEFFAKNPNATEDDFKNSFFEKQTEEINQAAKERTDEQVAGMSEEKRVIFEQQEKNWNEADEKIGNNFMAKHPEANEQEKKSFISDANVAFTKFKTELDKELMGSGFDRVSPANSQRAYDFAHNYFKDRTDEVSQAVKEKYLMYGAGGSIDMDFQKPKEQVLKDYNDMEQQKRDHIQKLDEAYLKSQGKK